MNFEAFKAKYQKAPIKEYPNNVPKEVRLIVRVITYNHVNYIRQCLDGILMQQTNFDFYILIGEDESNDGTREICIEYAKKYPDKIRLLLHSRENNIKVNGRPSYHFNDTYCKYLVDSKYEAFCEGDDYWRDVTALQKQYDYLENHPETVMVYYDVQIYYEAQKQFGLSKLGKEYKRKISREQFYESSNLLLFSSFYRSGVVEIFNEKLLNIHAGDTVFFSKLIQHGEFQYLEDIKPAVYRVHSNGIHSSLNPARQILMSLQAREYMLEIVKEEDLKYVFYGLSIFYFKYFLASFWFEKRFAMSALVKGWKAAANSRKSLLHICKKITFEVINIFRGKTERHQRFRKALSQ